MNKAITSEDASPHFNPLLIFIYFLSARFPSNLFLKPLSSKYRYPLLRPLPSLIAIHLLQLVGQTPPVQGFE